MQTRERIGTRPFISIIKLYNIHFVQNHMNAIHSEHYPESCVYEPVFTIS